MSGQQPSARICAAGRLMMKKALLAGAANPVLIGRLKADGWQVATVPVTDPSAESLSAAARAGLETGLETGAADMLVVEGGPECAGLVGELAEALPAGWRGSVICAGHSRAGATLEMEALELATRQAALALAPRARVNVVVTGGLGRGLETEIAEAVALAAASPAMTGVVIAVAGEGGEAADDAAPYRWPPPRG